MSKTADNIAKVRARIQQAAKENHRDVNSIRLLAVSKTRGAEDIRDAFSCGIHDFGENYVQEAEGKIRELSTMPIHWHLIGPLQSNKTAIVAKHFDWFHALDRLNIAERLSRQRPPDMPALNVCIQVNIDEESTKSGIVANEIAEFATHLLALPHLRLRGLMVIPNPHQSHDQLKCSFSRARELFQALQQQFPQQTIDTLSMGMSADLELAIAEGSTLVRVGSDIFGARTSHL